MWVRDSVSRWRLVRWHLAGLGGGSAGLTSLSSPYPDWGLYKHNYQWPSSRNCTSGNLRNRSLHWRPPRWRHCWLGLRGMILRDTKRERTSHLNWDFWQDPDRPPLSSWSLSLLSSCPCTGSPGGWPSAPAWPSPGRAPCSPSPATSPSSGQRPPRPASSQAGSGWCRYRSWQQTE